MSAQTTPTEAPRTDPILRVRFEDGPGKALIAPIEFRIQAELSLKLAKMLVLELVLKRFKATLDAVLAALGFK